MNDESDDVILDILKKLQITIFTLTDGSRIMGEELRFNSEEGLSEVSGVLEILKHKEQLKLTPYIPGASSSAFLLYHSNIIAITMAPLSLKLQYYESLCSFLLKESEIQPNSNPNPINNHNLVKLDTLDKQQSKRIDLN